MEAPHSLMGFYMFAGSSTITMKEFLSKVFHFISIIVCLFCLGNVSAQAPIRIDSSNIPSYTTINYRVNNGLPQNTIKRMLFDKQGFLWFTNEKGLSRFDGSHFKNYVGSPFRIGFNRVFHIYNDSNRVLILNREHIKIEDGIVAIDSSQSFTDNLLMSNYAEILKIDDLEYPVPKIFSALKKGESQPFIGLNDSSFYLGSDYFHDPHFFVNGIDKGQIEVSTNIGENRGDHFFLKDGHFCTLGDGILRSYSGTKVIDSLSLKSLGVEIDAFWQSGIENIFIKEKNDSRIYLLETDNSGFYLKQIISHFENPSINCILEQDSTGNIWIGSKTDGLYYLRKQSFFPWHSIRHPEYNSCVALCEIGNDSILTDKEVIFTPNMSSLIKSKKMDEKRKILLKAKDHFILRGEAQRKNEIFSWVIRPWSDSNTTEIIHHSSNLRDYLGDRKGRLWTIMNYKLYQKSIADYHLYDLTKIDEEKSEAYALFSNPYQDELWVYYENPRQICVIKPESQEEKIIPIPSKLQGGINQIFFSIDGMAWISFADLGFYMFKDEKFIPLPSDPSNYLQFAHCILEDDNGFFWISSDQGLFKVLKQDLLDYFEDQSKRVYYHYYDKSWGFLNNEFNGRGSPCGISLHDGRMAFPSFSGIVVFDPNAVPEHQHGKSIIIDNFKIDQRDTVFSGPISLNPNFKELEFSIAHNYLGPVNNLYMEYKLEGFHDDWRTLSSDGKINFSSLSYGNYNLLVRKLTGSGPDNFISISFPFRVERKMHETWAFRIAIALILGLLIVGAFVIRGRIAMQRQRKLETIIEDKTREYKILNDELKLNMAKLRASEEEERKNNKLRTRMMAIYTHDISGPLRFIMTVAKKITEPNEKIQSEGLSKYLDVIHTTTAKIFRQTEHMFKLSYVEDEQFDFKLASFPINSVIEDIIIESSAQAQAKNINIINHISAAHHINTEKNILQIVVNNVLQNAIKFTDSGSIVFDSGLVENYDVINIKDSGMGMNPKKLEELKEGQNVSSPGTDNEKGTGFGLKVVKDLLKKLDAYMEIESEEGRGTTVSLFFKRDKAED